MAKNQTPYGSGEGTGAASVDLVVLEMPLGREFTEAEVEDEVRRRGLPERGAVYEHLRALRNRGFLRKTDTGWVRLDRATGEPAAPSGTNPPPDVPSEASVGPEFPGSTPAPGQRVWHRDNGWGTIVEVNPRSGGRTGRPTALVEWEQHRVEPWKRGESCSWVSLSGLSTDGPDGGHTSARSGRPSTDPERVLDEAGPAPSPTSQPDVIPASTTSPPARERTERLQWIKLVLEIRVVAVTLIGGLIALFWRAK